jgi:hypothetical protein
VTDFVEQCRREWKRLGVADAVANEMAADLAADLTEAEAEGVSPEEVLGSSVFDPRSFAAAWAAERGVIPSAAPQKVRSHSRGWLVLASIATLSVLGLIAAALVNLTARSETAAVWIASPAPLPRRVPSVQVQPPFAVQASDGKTLGWALLLGAMLAIILAAWLWARWIRTRWPAAPA